MNVTVYIMLSKHVTNQLIEIDLRTIRFRIRNDNPGLLSVIFLYIPMDAKVAKYCIVQFSIRKSCMAIKNVPLRSLTPKIESVENSIHRLNKTLLQLILTKW
jgi:hypothetical protein